MTLGQLFAGFLDYYAHHFKYVKRWQIFRI
jgi:hypothetical protein